MSVSTRWGLALAIVVALGGCGGRDDEETATYALLESAGMGMPYGGAYLSVHGKRSVPADPKYSCLSEFHACLAMDPYGKTPPVDALCPSSYTPEGTWTFEYRLWKDPYCTEPMPDVTCKKHENEWLGPGKNTNVVECGEDTAEKDWDVDYPTTAPVFLVMDDDAIDNGGVYFDEYGTERIFSSMDVNDDISSPYQRRELRFFTYHAGKIVWLVSGQVGDEGWFALKRIPYGWGDDWMHGLYRFVWEPSFLDWSYLGEVPFVTPLRGRGLAALVGKTVCALVYDSDVSVNYDPLYGDLQGETLGLVAFDVLDAQRLYGYSSGSLPKVEIRIRDAMTVCKAELTLFRDAPEPWSSSVPYDLDPWSTHDDDGYVYVIR
jgi:hypothetical protein